MKNLVLILILASLSFTAFGDDSLIIKAITDSLIKNDLKCASYTHTFNASSIDIPASLGEKTKITINDHIQPHIRIISKFGADTQITVEVFSNDSNTQVTSLTFKRSLFQEVEGENSGTLSRPNYSTKKVEIVEEYFKCR